MINLWDQTIQKYEHLFNQWPHAAEYQGIFDLISELREHPSFIDVAPGVSLATLYLVIPDKKYRVYIYYDDPTSLYHVYIGDGNKDWDHLQVNAGIIVTTLESYIQKIR